MNKHTRPHHNDTGKLAKDALGEARKRLATALESAREIAGNVRDKAVAGAKATHKAVHENPYKAITIALGVGAIIGFVIARRGSGKKE